MACSVRGPVLRLRHDRGDGFGRRLERRALRDRGLDLPELHETERADERRGHGNHQNHSLCHNSPYRGRAGMRAITVEVIATGSGCDRAVSG